MNNLQIFNSEEFGDMRTVTIDDETWFVGKDVANALGYERATKAIQDHVDDDDKDEVPIQDSIGRMQKTPVINESGLYALIFGSKLESAKRFKHWVTSEVLPTIRKTGGYQKQLSPAEIMRIQLGMIDDHENRIENLENNMTIDYGQQQVLGETVNHTVISILGGKESNAYKEVSKKVFAECNRDLKNYFQVNARNNVPKKRFEEALQYAQSWKPCTNTQLKIENANAQMNLPVQ